MSTTDVQRTLTYSEQKVIKQYLLIAALPVVVGFIGSFIAAPGSREMTFSYVLMVGGFAYGLFLHFRLYHNPGKPLLVLSPEGLLLQTVGKAVFIPWREVRGVEATTFNSWSAIYGMPLRSTFRNVTVVLISEDFYRGFIDGTALLHNRIWSRTFIPKGRLVQVALHHDILPVQPEVLRREVAARWHAFRDAEATTSAVSSAAKRESVSPASALRPETPVDDNRRNSGERKEPDIKFVVRWDKKS